MYKYFLANVSDSKETFYKEKYIPFDWSFGEISPNTEGVELTWAQAILTENQGVRLRITSATDVREVLILSVKTVRSKTKIADWNLQFAAYMQLFELEISSAFVAAVFAEGITLTIAEGTQPFWFFQENTSEKGVKNAPNAFLPHLLTFEKYRENEENEESIGIKNAWQDRFLSLESLQTFGWMQGVVFDGLFEMSKTSDRAKVVLNQQLAVYFGQNSLVYANYNNIKTIEDITTVESILPFAILAQVNSKHKLLDIAVNFCKNHANTEGVIADEFGDNRLLKTEECYTVAYPLAVLAKTLNRSELAELAIKTLKSRVFLLETDSSIFQRGTEKGVLSFENWGRGVAWYLLGLVKTLTHLPESDDKELLKIGLKKSVKKVLAYQQNNGLWYNFFHQSETGFETSGTAGIAAALMYGFNNNLLDDSAKNAAIKAQKGLLNYITPDGFLTGTAQINKPQGGEGLQLNGFRVISPYTLGFFAHFMKNA